MTFELSKVIRCEAEIWQGNSQCKVRNEFGAFHEQRKARAFKGPLMPQGIYLLSAVASFPLSGTQFYLMCEMGVCVGISF